ncbi:MAG: tandem-95 repeat protein [Chloroflexaceae bacterium]|nr:tandem-95 repeat protein [Chloroflexaceae bacterium]
MHASGCHPPHQRLFLAAVVVSLLVLLVIIFGSLPRSSLLAASQADVQLPAGPEDYVAYWPFDETSGGWVRRYTSGFVPDHQDAIKAGTMQWVSGRVANALQFPGSGYVQTDYTYPTPGVTAYSFSFWMKTTTRDKNQIIIENRGPNNRNKGPYHEGLTMGIGRSKDSNTDRGLFIMLDRDWVGCGIVAIPDVDNHTDIADGAWHHVAGIWSAPSGTPISQGQFQLYVDGSRQRSAEEMNRDRGCSAARVLSSPLTSEALTRIGGGGYEGEAVWGEGEIFPFEGTLDEFRIYDRKLEALEIVLLAGKEAMVELLDPPAIGGIGNTLVFTANAIGLEDPTYRWQESDGRDIFEDEGVVSFSWDTRGTRTLNVTSWNAGTPVTDTVTVLTDTHDVTILDVRIDDNLPPGGGVAFSPYSFKPQEIWTGRVVLGDYQWEATDQPSKEGEQVSYQWDEYGTRTVTLTARSTQEYIRGAAVVVEDVVINPLLPRGLSLSGASIVAFNELSDYEVRPEPFPLSKPITYVWWWNEDQASSPSSAPEVSVSALESDYLTDTLSFAWLPDELVVPGSVSRTITATIQGMDGKVLTTTKVVSVTHRPVVLGSGGFGSFIPDQEIFEDTDPVMVSFSVVDTDTMGMLTFAAIPFSQTGELALSDENFSFRQSPPEPGGVVSSTFTMTPTAQEWGEAGVTIRACDENSICGDQTFHLTVTQVNDPPEFTLERDTVSVDTSSGPQSFEGWATGISPGPLESTQSLTFTTETSNDRLFQERPEIEMTATDPPSGTLRFTPANDVYGSAVVTVTLRDSGGTAHGGIDSTTRVFTITVRQPLVAGDGFFTILEDTSLVISDTQIFDISTIIEHLVDMDQLGVVAVGPARNGVVALTEVVSPTNPVTLTATTTRTVSSVLHYTPTLNFFGTDCFTYTIGDGFFSDTGLISITIVQTSDPPAGSAAFTVPEDTSLVISPTRDLLLTTTDPDPEDRLTWGGIGLSSSAGGTLAPDSDGNYTYTPAADFFGEDTFTYQVSDGVFTPTMTALVTVTPVNDAPAFVKGSDVVRSSWQSARPVVLDAWATGVSRGAANESAQVLTFTLTADQPGLFSVLPAIDPDTGSLSFTIAPDAVGVTQVAAVLQDSGGTAGGGQDTFPLPAGDPVTFLVEMIENSPPTAETKVFTTTMDVPLVIPTSQLVSGNTDPDPGDEDLVAFGGGASPSEQGGTIVTEGDNLTYTPPEGFVGTDTFHYTTTDGDAVSAEGEVEVVVVEPPKIQVYLPLILRTSPADLVVSNFRIDPSHTPLIAGEPVTLTVEIANEGAGDADPFWVDLYLNPSRPPEVGDAWKSLCTEEQLHPDAYHCYGLAWGVPDGLEAGEQLRLTTDAGDTGGVLYDADYSTWEHTLTEVGQTELYVYVDSWKPDDTASQGAVSELSEENNRAVASVVVAAGAAE